MNLTPRRTRGGTLAIYFFLIVAVLLAVIFVHPVVVIILSLIAAPLVYFALKPERFPQRWKRSEVATPLKIAAAMAVVYLAYGILFDPDFRHYLFGQPSQGSDGQRPWMIVIFP